MKTELMSAPVQEAVGQGSPQRILFVCTGNTCRSPMAAAVCNHLARQAGRSTEILAESAGLYANDGAPITPAAKDALQKAEILPVPGMEYTRHVARTVSAADMAVADRVVTLTRAHALELMLRFPEAASRIETFPTDILDPFGGSAEVYEACLAQLTDHIKQLFFAGEDL